MGISDMINDMPGLVLGALFGIICTGLFFEIRFQMKYSGTFSYIASELQRILKEDQTQRHLQVDIGLVNFFGLDEEWIKEFIRCVKSGEIEIKWASEKWLPRKNAVSCPD